MKSRVLSAAAWWHVLAASVAAPGQAAELPGGWFPSPTEKLEPQDFHGSPRYLTWMADSQIQHGVEPTTAYTVSAYYSGILRAFERTGDSKYYDYVKYGTDIQLYPGTDGVPDGAGVFRGVVTAGRRWAGVR